MRSNRNCCAFFEKSAVPAVNTLCGAAPEVAGPRPNRQSSMARRFHRNTNLPKTSFAGGLIGKKRNRVLLPKIACNLLANSRQLLRGLRKVRLATGLFCHLLECAGIHIGLI